MVIKAKFPGKCKKCGGKINVGEEINWAKGEGASHVTCPENPEPVKPQGPKKMKSRFDSKCCECGLEIIAGEEIYYQRGKGAWHVDCTAAIEKKKEEEKNTFWLVGGELTFSSLHKGQTVRTPKNYVKNMSYPEYLTVEETENQYISEDGWSFGCAGESGWICRAKCRKATEEEVQELLEKEQEQEEKRARIKAAQNELEQIKDDIKKKGEKPEGMNDVAGERVCVERESSIIYGGGTWFIISNDYIWYIENNGGDGDDWSYNNVRTSGAGAIGWRVPYNQELTDNLRKLEELI